MIGMVCALVFWTSWRWPPSHYRVKWRRRPPPGRGEPAIRLHPHGGSSCVSACWQSPWLAENTNPMAANVVRAVLDPVQGICPCCA